MHKYFGFHVLLPAQLSFGSRGNLRYSLGAYPTYSCSHCWASRTTSSATGQPQPCVGHQFSWEISFLTHREYVKWHIISQILQKRQEEEEMTTNSCSQRQPPRLLPALGRGSLPPACDCMEHILSHPSILAGVLHSNHLQRINTMWTIPSSHFIISWRSWFGTKT